MKKNRYQATQIKQAKHLERSWFVVDRYFPENTKPKGFLHLLTEKEAKQHSKEQNLVYKVLKRMNAQ